MAVRYFLFLNQSASIFVKCAHFSGSSSCGKIACTGQTGTQAPQSMQVSGSMYSLVSAANSAASFFGWMQSTGLSDHVRHETSLLGSGAAGAAG